MGSKDSETNQLSDNTPESFVTVSGLQSIETNSVFSTIHDSEFNLSQMNAQRLRDSTSPATMTSVLFNVWKRVPNSSSQFDLDDGEEDGEIHDLDVAELLFFSDSICKKLIRFTGFRHTSQEAKTAAIAVFTWFCTQPELLKSLMIETDVIVGWMMELALDKEPTVTVAGLKGLLKLSMHEIYRKNLRRSKELQRLLESIEKEANSESQRTVYVFKVFQKVMSSEGALADHERHLDRMLKIADTCNFSTMAEKYWSASCIQSAITLSNRRTPQASHYGQPQYYSSGYYHAVNSASSATAQLTGSPVFKKLVKSLSSEALERLLDARIKVYLTLLRESETNTITVDAWLIEHHFCELLLKRLIERSLDERSTALKLLALIVAYNPTTFYNENFDCVCHLLQHALENESSAETAVISSIFRQLSTSAHSANQVAYTSSSVPWHSKTKKTGSQATSAVSLKKKRLTLKDGGKKLLQLLAKNLTDDGMDIMLFLWNQSLNIAQGFAETEISESLLSRLIGGKSTTSDTLLEKIRILFCAFLQSKEKIGDKTNKLLKERLKSALASTEKAKKTSNLALFMLLFEAAAEGHHATNTAMFLFDEGLDLLVENEQAHLPHNLYIKLLAVRESNSGFFVKKFLRLLKLLGHDGGSLFQNHDWRSEFDAAVGNSAVALPELVPTQLQMNSILRLLSVSIRRGTTSSIGYIRFLMEIIGKSDPEQHSDKDTSDSTAWSDITQILQNWTRELAGDQRCSVQLLRLIATTIGCGTYGEMLRRYNNSEVLFDRLFLLFDLYGLDEQLETKHKKRVLFCIRAMISHWCSRYGRSIYGRNGQSIDGDALSYFG